MLPRSIAKGGCRVGEQHKLMGSLATAGSGGLPAVRDSAQPGLEPAVAMRRLGQRLLLARTLITTNSSHKPQQVATASKTAAATSDQRPTSSSSSSVENHKLDTASKYQARMDHLGLWHSVDTIKRHGHRLARLDPLGLARPEYLEDISLWSQSLLERMRTNSEVVPTRAFLDTKQPLMPVGELLDSVWNIYADGECGLEFAHMSSELEIEWLTSQWEKLNEFAHLDRIESHNLAKLMLECETFDHFMAAKYPATKRYGCEGAEPMLVVFDELLRLCHLGCDGSSELARGIDRSGRMIDNVIIGMPHRGRLNLLACLLGFEPAAIFAKTQGEPELDLSRAWMAQCDVLSHLSTNCRFVYGLGRGAHIGLSRDSPEPINVSLLPNPSHLEVASPMAMGVARGRAHNLAQGYSSSPKFVTFVRPKEDEPADAGGDEPHELWPSTNNGAHNNNNNNNYASRHLSSVLPIQVHGDAAVAGQGIMQETLQMANLPGFTAGGSIHLVVNNQIGYTTEPTMGRSSRHCTDIFKLIEAPIVHVNASNISAVVRATRLALAYRQRFAKDVAINLICYRQHGHNELDEPSFTQPLMYSRIRERKSLPRSFCNEIDMPDEERTQIVDSFRERLVEAHKRAARYKPDNDNYRNFELPSEFHRDHVLSWQTGFELEQLRRVALDSVRLPQGETNSFQVHPNLQRVLINERVKRFSVDSSELARTKVDWATAEILAFGSLLRQNHSVRLAGQDVARGTFSTRHAVLYDQRTQRAYIPLNALQTDLQANPTEGVPGQAKLEVANTVLSEEAALAYEFGYSIETCELTLWEAQFGDFFNTAQSIIDTLVSSAESKWLKQSALTLLLPHGLDGAGPEHSSAHLERFLQMSNSSLESIDTEAKCNWSLVNPTQPAQYFHLLRRQIMRPFRKPLVVMSPKVIFRHPECQSELGEFAPDKCFQTVLDDPSVQTAEQRAQVDTVVLCSGKIYFTLNELKRTNQMDNVALVRVEELCPFPVQSIMQTLHRYPNVDLRHPGDSLVWFQEEHRNQGAYQFVSTRLANIANVKLAYMGRAESELPATGSNLQHKRELADLVKQFQGLKSC